MYSEDEFFSAPAPHYFMGDTKRMNILISFFGFKLEIVIHPFDWMTLRANMEDNTTTYIDNDDPSQESPGFKPWK